MTTPSLLSALKQQAELIARENGHDLKPWQDFKQSPESVAFCRRCGHGAVVSLEPGVRTVSVPQPVPGKGCERK